MMMLMHLNKFSYPQRLVEIVAMSVVVLQSGMAALTSEINISIWYLEARGVGSLNSISAEMDTWMRHAGYIHTMYVRKCDI